MITNEGVLMTYVNTQYTGILSTISVVINILPISVVLRYIASGAEPYKLFFVGVWPAAGIVDRQLYDVEGEPCASELYIRLEAHDVHNGGGGNPLRPLIIYFT